MIKISLHWPHDRFALGWEFINKDEECNYYTITLYLFIATIDFNFE